MAEIKGIDVSANQGNINWKAVANYFTFHNVSINTG